MYKGEMTMVTEAQKVRRDKRRLSTYSKIAGALKWNIGQDGQNSDGMLVGDGHPGIAGLVAARAALGCYELGGELETRYAGMTRSGGVDSAHGMGEGNGLLRIYAQIRTPSGVKVHFDVPLVVTAGRILPPSVILHDGVAKVITQSTFDDMVMPGTFSQPLPTRANVYSLNETNGSAQSVVRNRRHMYTVARLGGDQSQAYLDPAERDCDDVCVGSSQKLKQDLVAKDRGGSSYELLKGLSVKILKDMAGDGAQYEVEDEDGDIFVIPGAAFSKEAQYAPNMPRPPATRSDVQSVQNAKALGNLIHSYLDSGEIKELTSNDAMDIHNLALYFYTVDLAASVGSGLSHHLLTLTGHMSAQQLSDPSANDSMGQIQVTVDDINSTAAEKAYRSKQQESTKSAFLFDEDTSTEALELILEMQSVPADDVTVERITDYKTRSDALKGAHPESTDALDAAVTQLEDNQINRIGQHERPRPPTQMDALRDIQSAKELYALVYSFMTTPEQISADDLMDMLNLGAMFAHNQVDETQTSGLANSFSIFMGRWPGEERVEHATALATIENA